MDLITLAVQLVSGAVGGNIVGSVARNLSLGLLGNSLAGIVGGGVGAYALQALGMPMPAIDPSNLDFATLATQIGGGAAGGGILMAVIGMVRKMFG